MIIKAFDYWEVLKRATYPDALFFGLYSQHTPKYCNDPSAWQALNGRWFCRRCDPWVVAGQDWVCNWKPIF